MHVCFFFMYSLLLWLLEALLKPICVKELMDKDANYSTHQTLEEVANPGHCVHFCDSLEKQTLHNEE